MKKLLALPMLALLIASCGTAPGQISGNSRASVGVSVDDSKSTQVATKTVTPAKPATGTEPAVPEKVSWAITPGGGVTFTFMTRPGSDAVYISGFRIVKDVLTTVNGTTTSTTSAQVNKADLYLTSGYACEARTALYSCPFSGSDTVPANGLTGQLAIALEGGLGSVVVNTNNSVVRVTDLEFYGTSSTGQAVTVAVSGVVSAGTKQGDQ